MQQTTDCPVLPRIVLSSCPKTYTKDLDKAISPAETLEKARERCASLNLDILAETRRVDVGRLGIPVFMSICGRDARGVMPTHKQMGKGSSPEQAEASAVMELIERFSYFSCMRNLPHAVTATWDEAKKRFGEALIPVEEILLSVQETLDPASAEAVLNTVTWRFAPATELGSGRITWIPVSWFQAINEFNGTSAGNTEEESLLQGLAELIERHACARIDQKRPRTATLSTAGTADPVLQSLVHAFEREQIPLLLKDFSQSMPLPTVGALAYDPRTFPEHSEIVFTAGTASSPTKAAIRAITEVAQLGGDFCTDACYEASGLPKFHSLEEIAWLREGETVPLESLPTLETDDIAEELRNAVGRLAPRHVYAIRTTHPQLDIPAHYTIVPGLSFRERDRNQCIGLFTGRRLVEEEDPDRAEQGLRVIADIYGSAPFVPFFHGMLAMRNGAWDQAEKAFRTALPLQTDSDSRGLVAFYTGYAFTLQDRWTDAVPLLQQAVSLCPDMKEYHNLLGVSYYRTQQYTRAKETFAASLRIDKGSAMDLANLGLCEKQLAETEAAREHLTAALELDPTITFARSALKELEETDSGS